MTEVRTEKTIRLTGLDPENYRLWAAQCESTFRVHGVLDIVLGREPNPERAVLSTPSDELSSDADGAQARPITAAQRKAIEKWQNRVLHFSLSLSKDQSGLHWLNRVCLNRSGLPRLN